MLHTLPLDILYQILAHLAPVSPNSLSQHPFLQLAQTCTALQRATEAFSAHLVTALSASVAAEAQATATASAAAAEAAVAVPATYRRAYMQHATKHCRFCNVATTRRATIFPGVVCCRSCDTVHWPRRITLEYATKVYGVNGRELTENCACGPIYRRWGRSQMFDEDEVRAFVRRLYGDLDAYLRRRDELWEREKNKAAEVDPTLPVEEERRRRSHQLRSVFYELQQLELEGDEDSDGNGDGDRAVAP